MKKKTSTSRRADRDTMRSEYDFSGGVRGVTAARYAQGTNIVVIDPRVLDVFPNAEAVNSALRALAPVLRRQTSSKDSHKAKTVASVRTK
jgi:hypothetical protein